MQKLPNKTLIIDVANLLFRAAATQNSKYGGPDLTIEDRIGLSLHVSLLSVNKWFNKIAPEFVVFAFEGDNNWRKTYTKNADSRRQYKGNRVKDPEMEHYYRMLVDFRTIIKDFTSICCLHVDTMEGDDVIAGFCQLYADDTHEITIVSGDKDFTQLLKLPNVKLVNPDNGALRNQPNDKDYTEDLDYWLFRKCIKG